MSDDVKVERPDAPRFQQYTRELSFGEMTSLEKIASYRALVGKQAAEIRRLKAGLRDAMDQLRPDEPAYKRLALALPTPEDQP